MMIIKEIEMNLQHNKATPCPPFNLILGNLPKNYMVHDVKYLVEEAEPLNIGELLETRVFNVKFCQITLKSYENLVYLIKKLNGFILRGEKLIAIEKEALIKMKRNEMSQYEFY